MLIAATSRTPQPLIVTGIAAIKLIKLAAARALKIGVSEAKYFILTTKPPKTRIWEINVVAEIQLPKHRSLFILRLLNPVFVFLSSKKNFIETAVIIKIIAI